MDVDRGNLVSDHDRIRKSLVIIAKENEYRSILDYVETDNLKLNSTQVAV